MEVMKTSSDDEDDEDEDDEDEAAPVRERQTDKYHINTHLL